MSALFLGIDGGGTSTTAWLAGPVGPILGRGQAGPSNVRAIGPKESKAALDLAISRAFDDAGIARDRVTIACLGLAGFDRLEEKRWLESWSEQAGWAARLVLVNDGDLVVAAGTPDRWGVGVIAGTGSIAVGRSKTGRTARAGGWGYLIGDEGSGYAVALAGLRKVARRADGRESIEPGQTDELTRLVCQALEISRTSELVPAIYRAGFDRARIASLAPVIIASAERDRSIVEEILEPAGVELAGMVLAVARTLEIGPGPLPLACAGSFLLHCPSVADAMLNRVQIEGYDVTASNVTEPVEGAIILARRAFRK